MKQKESPKRNEKYVLKDHENDPFYRDQHTVTVLEVRDGWVKYLGSHIDPTAKPVQEFLDLFVPL